MNVEWLIVKYECIYDLLASGYQSERNKQTQNGTSKPKQQPVRSRSSNRKRKREEKFTLNGIVSEYYTVCISLERNEVRGRRSCITFYYILVFSFSLLDVYI